MLSLCAASRMWVRRRSVVIVPPEGGLKSRRDSQCWWFIHVTVKLVLGTIQKSVIESWNIHVSSSPQETLLCASSFLADEDSKEGEQEVGGIFFPYTDSDAETFRRSDPPLPFTSESKRRNVEMITPKFKHLVPKSKYLAPKCQDLAAKTNYLPQNLK